MKSTALALGALLTATLVSAAFITPGGAEPDRPKPKPARIFTAPLPMVDFDEQYAIEQQQIADYLAAVEQQRQIDAYLEALHQAELQEQARQAAAARTSAAVPTIRTSNGSGPHSDAWWWGVAICEQGGRNDPYFGYFSWMDGSAAGLTWEQQVAKSNALLARVSSESPAWAASCVAAGYRASPGG